MYSFKIPFRHVSRHVKATQSYFSFNCSFQLIISSSYILVITLHGRILIMHVLLPPCKKIKETVSFMCCIHLRRGWRTSGCHSSTMLWEWQSDVLQPLFRQWQDCITVILLANQNQHWKQKNHDKRAFQSFLLCICPVLINRRMHSVSLWLGSLYFGHAFAVMQDETQNETHQLL